MKQTSIFQQLIYNIVLPVVAALLLFGFFNLRNTRVMLQNHREARNFLISDELIQVLSFQDITLLLIEEKLNQELEQISHTVVTSHLLPNKDMREYDLKALRAELGLAPSLYDLYLINRNGVVINTTFDEDLGLDFFSFGIEHENLIRSIFTGGEFVSERFTMESNTRRLKKFTYEPTIDGNYIFELGVYSPAADEVIDIIKNMLLQSSGKHSSIVSAELFMNADDPFSLTNTDGLDPDERDFIKERFVEKDSVTVYHRVNGRRISCQYIYSELNSSQLYKGSVIRIVTDLTDDIWTERYQMFLFIAVFIIILGLIITLIYRKTRVITTPIKKLVEHVNRISQGNLSERSNVSGSIEIVTLSRRFNKMISELEELYNKLEQKVKERTAQVVAQKEELERQRDKLTEQQKHILDSIHYSKRLQNAILPSPIVVREMFPESFVLFRPKDIVSGDFYWVHQSETKFYFSAIDCTGHGVPGAMVSMVGNNWLNYAVKDLNLDHPSDILNALNEGVVSTFKETGDDGAVKDGMDLALCCIDYKNMRMEFAGAYNPVIIIRDNEINVIKGDKFPIGAYHRGVQQFFTNYEEEIKKGDVIYVFSDGYPDQFGGDKGNKFMVKRFRELLLEIHQKPMDEQHLILEKTIVDWMGLEEQIDDITVIGVRV